MRKDDQINFKITHDNKLAIKKAAKMDHKSVASWITDLCNKRIKEQQEKLNISKY